MLDDDYSLDERLEMVYAALRHERLRCWFLLFTSSLLIGIISYVAKKASGGQRLFDFCITMANVWVWWHSVFAWTDIQQKMKEVRSVLDAD